MCVLGCTHVCVKWEVGLFADSGSARPPPTDKRAEGPVQGRGAGTGAPALLPAPLHSLPSGDGGGGVSPPEPLAFEVLPVSLRAGKLRVRKDGGGGGQ